MNGHFARDLLLKLTHFYGVSSRNTSQELFVSAVNKADEGEYWCRASNAMGSADSNRVAVNILGTYVMSSISGNQKQNKVNAMVEFNVA